MDNELERQIVELFNNNHTGRQISRMLNVTRHKVLKVLKKYNLKRTLSDACHIRNQDKADYYYGERGERSQEFKERCKEIALSRDPSKHGMLGKTHTPEVKKKLSESAKKRTAKRNSNYRRGNYERRPRDYKIAELTKIRKDIFNRDAYTCHYCLQKGNHLHAHHILPYWVAKEAFLDKENLITVCSKCHFDKAHLKSWHKFDTNLATDDLLKKYSLDRKRLNELAGNIIPDAKVCPSV